MKFVDQVREHLGLDHYHNGWMLDDFNRARKYGYQDIIDMLKPEILRRYRKTRDERFKRRAALALARETPAEHQAICAFHVFRMTEPCDCGGLEAALGEEQ
jgi:hypothetical protein